MPVKVILRLVAGLILIMLGVVGLILPIIQGWALLLAGIYLISPTHGQRITAWGKMQFARLRQQWERSKV